MMGDRALEWLAGALLLLAAALGLVCALRILTLEAAAGPLVALLALQALCFGLSLWQRERRRLAGLVCGCAVIALVAGLSLFF